LFVINNNPHYNTKPISNSQRLPNGYVPGGSGVHVSTGGCVGAWVGGGATVGWNVGVGERKRVGCTAVGNSVGTKISVGKNPVG